MIIDKWQKQRFEILARKGRKCHIAEVSTGGACTPASCLRGIQRVSDRCQTLRQRDESGFISEVVVFKEDLASAD